MSPIQLTKQDCIYSEWPLFKTC